MVKKLGCQARPVEHATLVDGKPWTVDLGAGSYWVWVDSHFVTTNGWSGQVNVAFGLAVSSKGVRGVIEDASADGGCDAGVGNAE
jgi:hypothetical protein